MKSPKPIVAGALVAGGLLFTSAAAALTLPEAASETAKAQVKALIAGESEDAKRAADDRRQDDTEETTTETEEAEVEATDGDEEEGGERPETHGSKVSALATDEDTKALDGRDRGAAISELARTNGGAADDDGEDRAKAEADVEDDTDDTDDTEDTEDVTDDEDDDDAGTARAAKARQGK